MSDLTATNCGCNNNCSCNNNSGFGGNSGIWIILLLFCCGGNGCGGNGILGGGCGNDCRNNNNLLDWLHLALFDSCYCDGNKSYGNSCW